MNEQEVRQAFENLKRELELCTPNGSEFHNNPDFCIRYIKEQRIRNCELIKKLIIERNNLKSFELKVEEINAVLKTVSFKDFIPVNGIRNTNRVTLHNNARKRLAIAIVEYLKGKICDIRR